MIKYFVGIIGALVGALAGAWLIAAPFILAYQPEGADWADPTFTDFWTGLALLVVSVVGLIFYSLGLVEELRARGVIENRAAPQQTPEPVGQTNGQSANGGTGDPSDPSIEQALAPLLAEMLRDMQEQRRSQGAAADESTKHAEARDVHTEQTQQYENQRQVRQ